MQLSRLTLAPVVLGLLGCSLVDSVSGYAGPPIARHDAGLGGDAGGDAATGGGAGIAGSTGCSQSSCDDGNACNGVETCGPTGQCEKGTPPTIDDANSCTTDSCTPDAGVEHVMGSFPTQTQCIATASEDCAADWYRTSYVCCLTQCGDCSFGVNAVTCDRACATEIQICCGIDTTKCDATNCPAGYTKTGTVSSDCTCGVASYAVVCHR